MKRMVILVLILVLVMVPILSVHAQEGDKYTKYLALRKDEVKALQLSAFIPGAGLDYIGTPEALERKKYYIMTEGLCALAAIGGLFIRETVDLGYGVTYTRVSGAGWAVMLLGTVGFYYFKGQEKEEIRDLVLKYNRGLKEKLGISEEVGFKDGKARIALAYRF